MAHFEPIPAKKIKVKGFQHPCAPGLSNSINDFLKNLNGEVVDIQLAADAGVLAALVLYTEKESPNEM